MMWTTIVALLMNLGLMQNASDEAQHSTKAKAAGNPFHVLHKAAGPWANAIANGSAFNGIPKTDYWSTPRSTKPKMLDICRAAVRGRSLPPAVCDETEYENCDRLFCAAKCRQSCKYESEHKFERDAASSVVVPHHHTHVYRHLSVVGRRIRLSGVTDVALIGPNHFVSMSYGAREIYLFRFDVVAGTAALVALSNVTWEGVPTIVDLLDWDPTRNRVVASNFNGGSQTEYVVDIKQGTIKWADEYRVFEPVISYGKLIYRWCHSAKFVPAKPTLVIATSVLPNHFAIGIFDTVTRTRIYKWSYTEKNIWHPQDTEPIGNHHTLVLYTTSKVLLFAEYASIEPHATFLSSRRKCFRDRKISKRPPFSTKLVLYEIDLANPTKHVQVAELTIPDSHPDAVVYRDGFAFINDQYNDAVHVISVKLNDLPEGEGEGEGPAAQMSLYQSIGGYHLPHGVDVAYGLLAVSNYGDNTVKIMPLPHFTTTEDRLLKNGGDLEPGDGPCSFPCWENTPGVAAFAGSATLTFIWYVYVLITRKNQRERESETREEKVARSRMGSARNW
jgi:hypothetical protein